MESTSLGTFNQVPDYNFDQNSAELKQAFDEFATKNTSNSSKAEITPSVYIPHWITDGPKHPGLIVETPGLANVTPPPITYRPNLPKKLFGNSKRF